MRPKEAAGPERGPKRVGNIKGAEEEAMQEGKEVRRSGGWCWWRQDRGGGSHGGPFPRRGCTKTWVSRWLLIHRSRQMYGGLPGFPAPLHFYPEVLVRSIWLSPI